MMLPANISDWSEYSNKTNPLYGGGVYPYINTNFSSGPVIKNIPCIVEKFPSNFICNFRNVKFIAINDFVLINVEHKAKNFKLKYDINNDTSYSIRIIGIFNEKKEYTLIFKLVNGNAENPNDILKLEEFKIAFQEIFETSIKEDSLCEKCVFSPKYYMDKICDKTFESATLKEW